MPEEQTDNSMTESQDDGSFNLYDYTPEQQNETDAAISEKAYGGTLVVAEDGTLNFANTERMEAAVLGAYITANNGKHIDTNQLARSMRGYLWALKQDPANAGWKEKDYRDALNRAYFIAGVPQHSFPQTEANQADSLTQWGNFIDAQVSFVMNLPESASKIAASKTKLNRGIFSNNKAMLALEKEQRESIAKYKADNEDALLDPDSDASLQLQRLIKNNNTQRKAIERQLAFALADSLMEHRVRHAGEKGEYDPVNPSITGAIEDEFLEKEADRLLPKIIDAYKVGNDTQAETIINNMRREELARSAATFRAEADELYKNNKPFIEVTQQLGKDFADIEKNKNARKKAEEEVRQATAKRNAQNDFRDNDPSMQNQRVRDMKRKAEQDAFNANIDATLYETNPEYKAAVDQTNVNKKLQQEREKNSMYLDERLSKPSKEYSKVNASGERIAIPNQRNIALTKKFKNEKACIVVSPEEYAAICKEYNIPEGKGVYCQVNGNKKHTLPVRAAKNMKHPGFNRAALDIIYPPQNGKTGYSYEERCKRCQHSEASLKFFPAESAPTQTPSKK